MTSLNTTLYVTTLALASVAVSSFATACPTSRRVYSSPTPNYVTHSRPVYRTVVATPAATPAAKARELVTLAKSAFRRSLYAEALQHTDRALTYLPKDANLHQLRSLCLFAQADYKPAAASAYTAFTLGNAWTWPALRELYTSTEQYKAHYTLLARMAKDADEAHLHFLLAYHHLVLDHQEAGRRELELAQQLLPGDPLVAALLKVLPAPASTAAAASGNSRTMAAVPPPSAD